MVVSTKRFCVVIEMHTASSLQRIANDLPGVIQTLARFSVTAPLPAFRSKDGLLSAFFIETGKPLRMLNSEIDTKDGRDAVLIFEIGQEFVASQGLTRVGSWLQHH